MNDNNEKQFEGNAENYPVFIIVCEASKEKDGPKTPMNVLLIAPDDDSAVQKVLETLAQQGYVAAELHQIGNIEDEPTDPDVLEPYKAAMAGEVAIVTYESDETGMFGERWS